MPTFTSIADSDLEAGDPITQSLMQAIKNNQEAIFKGDPTAPQIKLNAFDTHQGDGEPDADTSSANYIIASVTGHTNTSENICRIDIRNDGNYLLCYDARQGENTFVGSSSGNITNAHADFVLQKAASGSTSYSDITGTSGTIDMDSTGEDDGRAASLHVVQDVDLTAGDKIVLKVTEVTTPIEVSATFYIAVKDKRSMVSRDAIGVIL